VLKPGENPPLDAYDNFVIGPEYARAHGVQRAENLFEDNGRKAPATPPLAAWFK
jgi:hypothetical protein